MPEQPNITNIPSARVEIIDSRTGMISREWYRFFLNLFNLAGNGGNQTSLDDLQIGPPPSADATSSGGGTGTVTSVDVSGGTTGITTTGGPITTSGTITLAGTLAVANGGTGATTLTANNVILGNGTSAVQLVAPGASGNVLTSNGTTWSSAASSSVGFKNRLFNGAMVIDQRNAGASVTVNTSGNFFAVDRFFGTGQATDGVFTVQQSAVAPTGFVNSLIATVTTADASLGATQQYLVGQNIEGFNVADLGWGTASAATVTLSFWVRSSLTGTFGGSIVNSAVNRSYPFSYTISSANTWEQKSVTIAGDTSGTWLTTNGVGLRLLFSLGAGSTYVGTAGAWDGSYKVGVTGQTQVISTLSATFYITGVQLEKSSAATSFDYRPYGTELGLCQRYYVKYNNFGVKATGYGSGPTSTLLSFTTPVEMRTTPTFTAGTSATTRGGDAAITPTGYTVASVQANIVQINASLASGGTGNRVFVFTSTSGTELSAEL